MNITDADRPSEAALRKACEVLETENSNPISNWYVTHLARHFDAEDKAAREAMKGKLCDWEDFIRRHIRPDPKPTVEQVIVAALGDQAWQHPIKSVPAIAQALRDAGLLREEV